MKVFDYIQARYYETKYPFIPLNEVIAKYGEGVKDELNSLRKDGLVRKRIGGNGELIEYLPKTEKI